MSRDDEFPTDRRKLKPDVAALHDQLEFVAICALLDPDADKDAALNEIWTLCKRFRVKRRKISPENWDLLTIVMRMQAKGCPRAEIIAELDRLEGTPANPHPGAAILKSLRKRYGDVIAEYLDPRGAPPPIRPFPDDD